jgi:hypothetical protein
MISRLVSDYSGVITHKQELTLAHVYRRLSSCFADDALRASAGHCGGMRFLLSLISTHLGGRIIQHLAAAASSNQHSSASIASSYHDQCARARNILILRCGKKDHLLLVPQSRQRIDSGRSPCRHITSENRGA